MLMRENHNLSYNGIVSIAPINGSNLSSQLPRIQLRHVGHVKVGE